MLADNDCELDLVVRNDALGYLDRITISNVARRRLEEEEWLGRNCVVELLGVVRKVATNAGQLRRTRQSCVLSYGMR